MLMIYVCMSSISMCFKLGCWGSSGPCVLFQCSCHWVMTHAVRRVRLGLFDSDGLLFSTMLFVLLCCVLCTASGLSQRRVGVGYALRVSPAVTRLTVYRRPQVCGKRGVQMTRAQDLCITFE